MGRGGGEGVNESCVRSATECAKVTSSARVPGQCEEQTLQPGDTETTELCQGIGMVHIQGTQCYSMLL